MLTTAERRLLDQFPVSWFRIPVDQMLNLTKKEYIERDGGLGVLTPKGRAKLREDVDYVAGDYIDSDKLIKESEAVGQ